MREQRGQSEQQQSLQQRVRPHLAQRQLALAGDDYQRQAEVTEGVFTEEEGRCARIPRLRSETWGTR